MHKILFYNKFIIYLYMFRALCAHHQEVKIVLYSIWYHHTCRWPSRAQVEMHGQKTKKSVYVRRWFSICWNRSLCREAHTSDKKTLFGRWHVYGCTINCISFSTIQYFRTQFTSWILCRKLDVIANAPPTYVSSANIQGQPFYFVYLCSLKSLENSVVLLTVNIRCVD